MALDLEIVRQIVGQEFDHATHGPVTAEELIAFARALGETRPEYTEPGPDLIGHPTYCVRYKGRKFYPENLPKVVNVRTGFDAGKDLELGVGFVKENVVGRPQVNDLEKAEKGRQVVEPAAGHVDPAPAAQILDVAAPPLQVNVGIGQAAQGGAGAEVSAAELFQFDIRRRQLEGVVHGRSEFQASLAIHLAAEHVGR